MSDKANPHRRFLLGTLPDEEADELVARMLVDDDALEATEAEEGELIDELIQGQLDEAEQQQLAARSLATPHGRERLAFGRALHRRAAASAPRRPVGLARAGYGLAMAAALGAALILLLPRWRPPRGGELSLVVLPARLRSATAPLALRLTPKIDVVHLRLVYDNPPGDAQFTAELHDARDNVRERWELARPRETAFELRVPARLFAGDGEYGVRLVTHEGREVAFYPLHVLHSPR